MNYQEGLARRGEGEKTTNQARQGLLEADMSWNFVALWVPKHYERKRSRYQYRSSGGQEG